MFVLHHIGRQLVCAIKGLAGHLPGAEIGQQEAEALAEYWGAVLRAEAEKFKRGHR
jgi:hypothetical protein